MAELEIDIEDIYEPYYKPDYTPIIHYIYILENL